MNRTIACLLAPVAFFWLTSVQAQEWKRCPEVGWSADGSLVELVDVHAAGKYPRWWFDPQKMETRKGPSGLISPGGQHRFMYDGRTLLVGKVGGKVARYAAPRLWDPDKLREDECKACVQPDSPSLVWWEDNDQIVWCEIESYLCIAECVTWDLTSKSFQTPGTGAGASFTTFRVQTGPGGWQVDYGSAEGHLMVNITGPTGKAKLQLPDLYDYGPLSVYFNRTGSRVWFVTPCLLERKNVVHPCMNDNHESLDQLGLPYRLYEWTKQRPVFTLLRRDLPPGAVPSPDGSRFAWLAENLVCVGDPAKPLFIECGAIPGSVRHGLRCGL